MEVKYRMELEDAKQKMHHLTSECRKELEQVIQNSASQGSSPQVLKAFALCNTCLPT